MNLLPLFTAFFQDETTGGVIEEAAKAAQEFHSRPETGSAGSATFGNTAAYLTSADFVVNVLATVIVVVLAIVFYRVAVHLIPRILKWSRPEDDQALDAASLSA